MPFTVGETLTYDVSWSAFLTAGTVVTTVKEKRSSYNSTAYYIVAEGRPTPLVAKLYPLYYKLDTLLDAFTLLPQRGSLYSEEGSRHALRTTTFDRRAQKAHRSSMQGTTTVKTDFPVPPDVQDALSAIYVLRAIPLKAGDRMTMPVSDDGVNYKVQVAIAAPERVKTGFGDISAWKLSPTVGRREQPAGRTKHRHLAVRRRATPAREAAERPPGRRLRADAAGREIGNRQIAASNKRERELILAIDPLFDQREARALEGGDDVRCLELVGALGPDRFAGLQRDVETRGVDPHALPAPAHQVHLDARFLGVPDRAMPELPRRSKSPPSSRLTRTSRLRLNAAVTPSGSA